MTNAATNEAAPYPARLRVDYPEKLDRLTTFLRVFWVIPILVILSLVTASGGASWTVNEHGQRVRETGGSLIASLGVATALMLLFRARYPRWWFDFRFALERFSFRVGSYMALLRDEYPSTEDEQAVHLELDYPDAARLSRWLPLVKWLLAIPHYIVLFVLVIFAAIAIVVAWFAILFTGRYPRGLFDFVVGVGRWALRVDAYALLLITDRYPPFSLD